MAQGFWASQPTIDVLYLTAGIGLLLGLLLLLLVPGLIGLTVNSYLHSRTERVSAYIARYVPYPIYSGAVHLLNALLGANLLLRLMQRLELFELSSGPAEVWGIFLGIFLGLLVWFAFYRISFSMWSYIYMPEEGAQLLKQDYFVIAGIRGLLMLPLTLILLSPVSTSICLWLLGGSFVLCQSLRWLQAVRRLWYGEDSYIYIFLYLCAHELLPWIYLVLGISCLRSSEYIEYII